MVNVRELFTGKTVKVKGEVRQQLDELEKKVQTLIENAGLEDQIEVRVVNKTNEDALIKVLEAMFGGIESDRNAWKTAVEELGKNIHTHLTVQGGEMTIYNCAADGTPINKMVPGKPADVLKAAPQASIAGLNGSHGAPHKTA